MRQTEHSPDLKCAQRLVQSWRQRGETFAFTNGCFDALHSGHRLLLAQARTLACHLIVAVNSDDYCRRVKGPQRPSQPITVRQSNVKLASQAELILELSEDEPTSLLMAFRPDFYVAGSDYRGHRLPGAEYCGQVVIVERLAGVSTTAILSNTAN